MRRRRHLRVGLHAAQRGHEGVLDAVQRRRGVALEAQHQNRRRVAAADQAEAVGEVHAQAVARADLAAVEPQPPVGHAGQQFGHHAVVLALGAGHVELGRAVARGQRVEHGARIVVARQDLEQARRRVGGVVEPVPALPEEQVPAHFAGERRTGLAQLGLDQRVAGLPQQRHAAGLADGHRQALAALDVVDDLRAGVPREDVAREQHDLAVGVDDVAAAGDHAEPVAVAVEGQAELGAGGVHHGLQHLEVLGLARVGVVVREVAVDRAVQVDDLAAQRLQDARGAGAGDAVAAVDHDLHRPREPAVADDAGAVLGRDVHARGAALRLDIVLGLDARAQLLDVVAVDGAAGQHHLEAVVVLRVVAAGDLDAARAAVPAARGGHVVEHRRRHGAEVDDVQPRRGQAADQRGRQAGARQAAVAAHRHRLLAGRAGLAAEGAAQVPGEGLVDGLADDTSDVIGLEGAGVGLHAGVPEQARGIVGGASWRIRGASGAPPGPRRRRLAARPAPVGPAVDPRRRLAIRRPGCPGPAAPFLHWAP